MDTATELSRIIAARDTIREKFVALGIATDTDQLDALAEAAEGIELKLPLYTGAYEVTPKIEAQRLDTANRSMEKDVTIHAIPYYEVDNAYNGQTIVIGGN